MLRHNWNHPDSLRNEFRSTASRLGLMILISVSAGLIGLLALSLPIQGILSNLEEGTPMHPAAYVGWILPTLMPFILYVILPKFHIYEGLNGYQRHTLRNYYDLPERARKELPPPSQVRKAVLECNDDECSVLGSGFRNLSINTARLVEQEKAMTPKQKSAAAEALLHATEDKAEVFGQLAAEYVKVNMEMKKLR